MKEHVIVEIRAAEGGEDAKLLVSDQYHIYRRMASKKALELTVVDIRPGCVTFIAEGAGAQSAFSSEPGGHRWQRVPPNERSGRRHTSTVTVAVLKGGTEGVFRPPSPVDLDWKMCRGSGAGGQHRNKVETAVQLTHRPTGTMVRCEAERSQHRNKELALSWLTARLAGEAGDRASADRNSSRRVQIGSGMRGDKVRTVRVMDGIVTNNLNGRKMPLADYLDGDIDRLVS